MPEELTQTETAAPEAAEAQPQVSEPQESQTPSDTTTETAEQPAADQAQGEENQEQATPEAPTAGREEQLADLIHKGEENPNIIYTDDELDILEEYYQGKLKPKTTEEPKTEKEPEKEPEKDSEPEEKEPEKEQESEPDETPELSSLDQQVMKEVGAKTKTEILEKIKGLRKAVSGKVQVAPEFKELQQNYEKLNQLVQNEQRLWSDYRAGKPEAIDFVKKNYIPESQDSNVQAEAGRKLLDRNKMADEEGAEHVNEVLQEAYKEIDNLKKQYSTLVGQVKTERDTALSDTVESKIVDEMVQVAATIPHLKNLPHPRDAIIAWRSGNNNPRMEYFNDLFEIANKHKVDLPTAAAIDRGLKAELNIAKAKSEAKKEVFEQKPNRSLSEVQGKQGDFHQYSDVELQDMANGNKPMPDSWFDDNDNPVPDRIPKRAHKYFGFPSA